MDHLAEEVSAGEKGFELVSPSQDVAKEQIRVRKWENSYSVFNYKVTFVNFHRIGRHRTHNLSHTSSSC